MHRSLFLLFTLSACLFPEGTDASETWGFESFAASTVRASLGERVELGWTFSTDDEIVHQELCLLYLYFDGIFSDCISSDLEGFGFETDHRYFDFTYEDPVMVFISAENEHGEIAQATLEVKSQQDAYLTASFTNSDPVLPYMGAAEYDTTALVEFSQFVALYDRNGNGVIDGLTSIFDDNDIGFFRAMTTNPQQRADRTFEHEVGPYFPCQLASDCWSFGYSNLIVYGGALAVYGGEEGIFKGEDGYGIWQTGPALSIEPIFLQMTYALRNETGIIDLVDINAGNLSSGLVTGVTSTNYSGTFGSVHEASIVQQSDRQLWFNGEYLKARSGTLITPYVTQQATQVYTEIGAEWQMPLMMDDEIGQENVFQPMPPSEY